MENKEPKPVADNAQPKPGDGIRSLRSTTLFRVVNYELYAKPNMVIMCIGLTAFGITLGYIAYMKSKYESQGYYSAIQEDNNEAFVKKPSSFVPIYWRRIFYGTGVVVYLLPPTLSIIRMYGP